jgi:TonB family protein
MSVRRIVSSLVGMAPLIAVAAVAGWQPVPLTAAPQAPDSPGVEVTEGFRLLHRAAVEYPREALASGALGDVVASVALDEKGNVADAKIVSGPQELRGAVLRSVLEWRFDPSQTFPADRTFEVSVRFTPPPAGVAAPMVNAKMPPLAVGMADLSKVPPALRDQVVAVLHPYEGQQITSQQLADLAGSLRNIDRDLRLGPSFDKEDKLVFTPSLSTDEPERSEAGALDAEPVRPMRIRVGGNVQAYNLIEGSVPAYPPQAKQARIQGTVRFNAVIGRNGHIKQLELVSGHPLLVQAARSSVEQWFYRPTLLNGDPVEVATQIDVNFTLSN